MQNDSADRIDLCRMADDGCPHADLVAHDLAEPWPTPGKDDRAGG